MRKFNFYFRPYVAGVEGYSETFEYDDDVDIEEVSRDFDNWVQSYADMGVSEVEEDEIF